MHVKHIWGAAQHWLNNVPGRRYKNVFKLLLKARSVVDPNPTVISHFGPQWSGCLVSARDDVFGFVVAT